MFAVAIERGVLLITCGLALATSFTASAAQSSDVALPKMTLKEAFKDRFLIGAAVNEEQFTERDTRAAALIKAQFNSITPENALKWESVHPSPGKFDFESSDHYVAFGQTNKMCVIGHTLVWHHQTPDWVFEGDQGKPLNREELLKRMREHIQTVVGRYKGKIHGWDVVNEALDEDGSMRRTSWQRIIGDDYVQKAFEFAHEADPKAELYYNDYSLENEPKRNGAVQLIRKLKAAGVPVAGIGLQNHDKMDWPTSQQLGSTIDQFASMGLKVMITELDVDVLPPAARPGSADPALRTELRQDLNPYTNGLPNSVQEALARRYAELFNVFTKHHEQITRVTFWGVTDGDSWLNNWPVRGRCSHPLLFGRDGTPKPAFDAIIRSMKREQARAGAGD
jgi:endo-1,4-beta-xylanase